MGWGKEYSVSFKISFCKILTDYKEQKKCTLLVEKPGSGHLNQLLKLTPSKMGHISIIRSLIGCNKDKKPCMCIPGQNAQVRYNLEET